MKTIYEHITKPNDNKWNYYERNGLNGKNPFRYDISHQEFIKQYLKDGDKLFVYAEFESIISRFKRHEHTNSVFFLGCLFYEYLDVQNILSYQRDGNQEEEFYFIWFLTSLLHDFAYEIENDFVNYSKNIKDIESLKQFPIIGSPVKYDLLQYRMADDNSKISNLLIYIENYFNYRYREHHKIDHGIVGGLWLFDLLEKNRLNRLEQQKKGIESNDYYWGEEVKTMYVQACNAIITHNIWKADTQEVIEQYKRFELFDLTNDSIYPISINEAPFLFFLGLIDTIDPVKTFDSVDTEYVLKNLLISFEDKNKIIIQNKVGSELNFNKLIKKAESIKTWLNAEINIHELDRIEIIISLGIN